MKKSFFLAMALMLLADATSAGQGNPAGQHHAIPGDVGMTIPAELAWITLFTEKIRKNQQGYWEVELADGIEMVYVPAGEFIMGSPREEEGWEQGEGPVHHVYIKGILIGKYEVTRALWRAVMGDVAVHPGKMDLPQGNVSYDDIQKFLLALKKKSGLAFRLPTEAEWEKCCRGGSSGPHYGPLDEIAWQSQNSGFKPHRVGSKKPNGFGIFDMLGNVWEWCSDWYDATYYKESPYLDPAGPEKGTRRVGRGGGFYHGGHYLRSAHRNDQDPARSKPYLGFRLVLDSAFQ
jgi:formylglycine-generating enzyme required for sulfatase activity